MKLRGIDFPSVFSSSGTRGFLGEKYWFQRGLLSRFYQYRDCGFISKTTTLLEQPGNLKLSPKDKITPIEKFPKCIKVYPFKRVVINVVSLSGPGAYHLFSTGEWQKREEPFFISFMSREKNKNDRMEETREFTKIFKKFLFGFKSPVGLIINKSCPNIGLDPDVLVEEVGEEMQICSVLGIPIVPNFNPIVSVENLIKLEKTEADAISICNSIPWGSPGIDWWDLFGTDVSPFKRYEYNDGALSGKPLGPIVRNLFREVKESSFSKPVMVGGGILSYKDLDLLFQIAKPDAIQFGTIGLLNPIGLPKAINHAIELLK